MIGDMNTRVSMLIDVPEPKTKCLRTNILRNSIADAGGCGDDPIREWELSRDIPRGACECIEVIRRSCTEGEGPTPSSCYVGKGGAAT